jgi:putative spermidine/putrescine transport system ATP-binding protein
MQTFSSAAPAQIAGAKAQPGAGIIVDKLRKSFGHVEVLNDVSFALIDGEFLTLLGSSGSGKSTTLGIIAGFIEPSSGDVRIGGRPMAGVPPRRRNLGVVFQNYALFPHLTVLQNVEFGLRMRNVPATERRKQAMAMLRRVALDGLQDRRPAQLSGGQQQRVALARALSIDPVALLLDEPLGALDRQLRQSVQLELKALQRDTGVSVLYVTHDQEEAMVLSDRIAVMRNGRILQIDAPALLYRYPRSRFVAEFLGEANMIEVRISRVAEDHVGVAYPDGSAGVVHCTPGEAPAQESSALVCLRPERIRLGPSASGLENVAVATVVSSVHIGPSVRYVLRCFAQSLIATVPDGDAFGDLPAGTEIVAGWPRQNAHLIGLNG